MRRGTISLLLFWALAALAFADKTTMRASFGGADAGVDTFENPSEGTLQSESDFSIAGMKFVGSLTMRTDKKGILSFDLKQKTGPTEYKCKLEGLKMSFTARGKTTSTTLKTKPVAAMASFHPQTLRTILAAYNQAKGGKQNIQALMLDAGVIQAIGVEKKGLTPFKKGDATVVLSEYELTIASGIAMLSCKVFQKEDGVIVGFDVPAQGFNVVLDGFDGVFVDPTSLYKELSQPTMKARVTKGVKVPMRDGVTTVADIAVPDAEGKYPAILVRTPYGRGPQFAGIKAEWWAKRGYAVVVQDCRGRHDSGGEWDPFMHERKDGYDSVEWIAKQPWSDGNVGMIGGSYSGEVQWAAAVENPPALKCIVPQVSPPDAMFNLPYDYGIFPLEAALWWTKLVKDKVTDMSGVTKPFPHGDKITTIPLTKLPEAVLGQKVPFFEKWVKRNKARDWAGWNYEEDMKNVQIPALMISGWWDGDGIGTKRNWAIMAGLGRANQWLIDGPWPHAFNTGTSFGGVDYGPTSVLELDSVYLRWFDTWLKHKDVGIDNVPKVRVFVTGANEWRELKGWPDPQSQERKLYLSEAKATSRELTDAPAPTQSPSTYGFDPNKATAPKGGGGVDVSAATTAFPLKSVKEGLVFQTPPLASDVDAGGPISIDLWFSTTARDVDFFGMVVDIDEKGASRMVGMPGKMRASYLSGWDNPQPIKPGKIYKVTLEHWDFARRFRKGHRIGLVIMSGMFPSWARNPGTGEPYAAATKMISSKETIYHDAAHPSCLRFMVLPAK